MMRAARARWNYANYAGWRSQPALKIRERIPFVVLGVKICLVFLTFPYPEPVPKKLCDFYWLQLRITCKSGWIAQAEKRYCVSKEGRLQRSSRRTTSKGCALDLTAQDLALGDWKYCLGGPAGRLAGVGFLFGSLSSMFFKYFYLFWLLCLRG